MPDAVTHPTTQELAAFGLGKLPERRAAAVAAHLESCPTCRKAVANVPADSFLGKVRAAKQNVSSLPSRSNDDPRIEKAAAPSAPPKDLPPDLANYSKYRFLRELGRGGMGVVYQAEQTVMGRTVAVKVINPSVLDHPDALPRFQSEVRAAAKLDHPNIVRAHDAEQVGSMHLLVMEYVEGTSLAELVAKKGPLPVAYACHFIRQAALGLQHAFEQGMVHRDIKPHNLMVNARGQVKVLDFGLARMRSERKAGGGLRQVDAFMGTPEYVSPEQATDARSADTRADIYSLGCTLFFLLTGRPPFQGDTAVKVIIAHLYEEAPSLQEVRSDVPAELSAVVARMLAKDPAQRFQTPLEVAQALAAFVKAGTKPVSGVSSPAAGVSSPGTGTMLAADTNPIKKVLREVLVKAAPKKVPARDAASPFADLTDAGAASQEVRRARKAAKPSRVAWWKRPGVQAAAVSVSLALVLMAVIIIKIKVQTPYGDTAKATSSGGSAGTPKASLAEAIVVLEIDQPGAEVSVVGENITVKAPGDNEPIEIKVEPGQHKLRISKAGFEAVTKDIELKTGKSPPIKIRLEPEPLKLHSVYKNRFGNWTIDGDELFQHKPQVDCQLVFGSFTWKDCDFSCEAKSVGDNAGIGLLYHVTGAGCGQFVVHKHPNGSNTTMDFAESVERGNYTELRRREIGRLELEKDRWYKLTVRLKGAHYQCFLDDALVFEYDDVKNPQGAVGLLASGPARFRKIRVIDLAGKVLFERLPKLPATEGQWFPATESSSAGEVACLKGHNAPLTCVAFSRAGQLLSCSDGIICGSAAEDNGVNGAGPSLGSNIRLWDGETGKELDCSPQYPEWGYVKTAVSPDGTHFLSSAGVNAARGTDLWEIKSGKLKRLSRLTWIKDKDFGIQDISFTPDGRKARAVCYTGSLWEWDVNDEVLNRQLPGTIPPWAVSCVGIAPNGKIALLARRNQPFAEIEFSTGKETGRWIEAAGVVRSMAIASDSTRLLTGGQDGAVRLWDVTSGKQIRLVGRHERPVLAVAFSPDGKRALSGSEDHTVRLWDLSTGKKELACFTGHTGAVNSVALSPDGRRAASGSADYTVRLWRLPPEPPLPKPQPDNRPRRAYKNLPGDWKVEGNELVQQALVPKCLLVFGDFGWKDYDFTIRAKSDGNKDVGLIFRATGRGYNTFVPGAWANTGSVVEWWESCHPRATQLGRHSGGQIKNDTWQTLRVSVHGTHCKCFVDHNLIHDCAS